MFVSEIGTEYIDFEIRKIIEKIKMNANGLLLVWKMKKVQFQQNITEILFLLIKLKVHGKN